MQLSLQVQYAICGVFDLAYSGDGQQVRVRIIGERQQIPTRYLEQIFQRLRKAGIVSSKRGPGGGYVLARPAADVTLRDIVEEFRADELEHRDTGLREGAEEAPAYELLRGAIKAGSRLAICLSTRG